MGGLELVPDSDWTTFGARFRVVSRNATANLTLVELQMDSPCALRRPEQLNFFERGGQNRVQPILSIGSQ